MARRPRLPIPELPHHVVNRGNDRRIVFRNRFDHTAFLELLADGTRRFPVQLFGYCLMPNHFHLVVQPQTEKALPDFMQWVTGQYACVFRRQTDTVGYGHVFQRRYWNAPLYDDAEFLTVLRYVEANAWRGSLVARAEEWEWSSLFDRAERNRGMLSALPVELPRDWIALVNQPQTEQTLKVIRAAIIPKPGRPPLLAGREKQAAQPTLIPQDASEP